MAKVSIGIPTYKRPLQLKQNVGKLLVQTFTDFELIISDNASPGNETQKICEEFVKSDSRVKYFKQAENIGAVKNFKFVAEKATGKYFMWASDDDYFSEFYLEKTVEFLDSNPSFVAVTMEAHYFDDNEAFDFFSEGKPFYSFKSEDVYNPNYS